MTSDADLATLADRIATILRQRGETVAVAESSAGGLVCAALLAVPGASAYFTGGAVVYTKAARAALLGMTTEDMAGMRAETEPYARAIAVRIRERHGASWGLGESGAAGPTGSRYGDASGHVTLAVVGPAATVSRTVENGGTDRPLNMRRFARQMLELFDEALAAAGAVTPPP
ncbi:MAG: CinA family protein [Burkholderiaceae bacterium]